MVGLYFVYWIKYHQSTPVQTIFKEQSPMRLKQSLMRLKTISNEIKTIFNEIKNNRNYAFSMSQTISILKILNLSNICSNNHSTVITLFRSYQNQSIVR